MIKSKSLKNCILLNLKIEKKGKGIKIEIYIYP